MISVQLSLESGNGINIYIYMYRHIYRERERYIYMYRYVDLYIQKVQNMCWTMTVAALINSEGLGPSFAAHNIQVRNHFCRFRV